MKYTTSVIIRRPLDDVIRLMDDPGNMPKWQEGLKKWEVIQGEPGEPGSKMKLFYDMGRRKVDMVETIIRRDFPHHFDASYDARGVHNIQKNHFEKVDETSTRWTSESEFRFSGFMRLLAFFMPGAFKKQTLKIMNDFKAFAEGE